MKKHLVAASCAAALALAGCRDAATAPSSSALRAAPTASRTESAAGVGLDAGVPSLPAGALLSDVDVGATRLIDSGDYVCPSSTPVTRWYTAQVMHVIQQEPATFTLLYANLAADVVATYDALLFETTATPQYFGYRGEYTPVMRKTERDVKRFWDIASDDIQVIGLHGTVLQDTGKVAATYRAAFALPAATASAFAAMVRATVRQSTTLHGGDHPLFSFNSFALSTPDHSIPDKIVMGDGVLAGYEALGFGDVAPQAVFAHEFAHHIQYERGYFADPYATAGTPPERSRYTELMADAYAAYYLTHSRGAAMNQKRVEAFLSAFFQIGDCAFANPGHHGTPNQRMAAARFGFAVADEARQQGRILASGDFHARFVAAYPTLIAPDAH